MSVSLAWFKVAFSPKLPRFAPSPENEAAVIWRWWLLAAALPLAMCSFKLNSDLWYDEAYTLIHYASRPWREIVTDYSAPNNHVLYSLILSMLLFVSNQEFVLRFPNLLLAALTFWFTYLAAYQWRGRLSAVLATSWLGCNQVFLNFAMQLRGYALSITLSSVLFWLAARHFTQTEAPSRGRKLIILVSVVCFLWIMPTNVLFVLPLCATVALYDFTVLIHKPKGRTVFWFILGIMIGCLLYLPIGTQLHAAVRQAHRWDLLASLRLFIAFLFAALYDWWPLLALVGVIVLLAASRQWITRQRRRPNAYPNDLRGRTDGSHQGANSCSWFSGASGIGQCLGIWFVFWLLAGVVLPFAFAAGIGIQPFVRNFLPALPCLAVAIGILLASTVAAVLPVGITFRMRRPNAETKTPLSVAQKNSSKTQGFFRRMPYEDILVLVTMAILLIYIVPRLWTYPERLSYRRRTERLQDGYYEFYASRYQPLASVRYVSEHLSRQGTQRDYQVIFPIADYYPLGYYFGREQIPIVQDTNSSLPKMTYFVVPDDIRIHDFAARLGIPKEDVACIALLQSFGFYRVYCLERTSDDSSF